MFVIVIYKEFWRVKGSGCEEKMEIRCRMNYCWYKWNVISVVGF